LCLHLRGQFLEGEEDLGGVGVSLVVEGGGREGGDGELFEEAALEDGEGVDSLVDTQQGGTV
jgi:hypothetical protein